MRAWENNLGEGPDRILEGVEKEGVTSKELAPGGVAESETGDQGGGEGGKGGRGGTCIWVTRSI